jgi:hypothetical protein
VSQWILNAPHIGTGALTARRVQHDADGSTESPRRDVRCELAPDDAAVAVHSGHSPPNDADLAAAHLFLCSVDVCNALCEEMRE